jgi:tripartite-type tricarboxylate transporter receptor subunit TctC
VLSTSEARKALAERGIDAASSTPEQFAAFIKSETARWAQAAKSAGIVPK